MPGSLRHWNFQNSNASDAAHNRKQIRYLSNAEADTMASSNYCASLCGGNSDAATEISGSTVPIGRKGPPFFS